MNYTDSWGVLACEGLGEYLAERIGSTWNPEEDYPAGTDLPTFLGPTMPTAPNRIIMLTPTTIEHVRLNRILGVQVRIRGDVDAAQSTVTRVAQGVLGALAPNGFPLAHVRLGELNIGAVLPGPMGLLPADAARRHEYVLNYRLRFRPTH